VDSRKQLIQQHQTLEAKIKYLEVETRTLEDEWRSIQTGPTGKDGEMLGRAKARENMHKAERKAWRKWKKREKELIERKREGEDGAYEELYDGRMVSMDV
jgi:hypothetical protein